MRRGRKPDPMVTTDREPEVETLVDARGAAEILGLSAKRVLALARERRVRHIRYGPRTIRFRPSDLYEYLRGHDGSDGLLDSNDAASVLGITREAVIRAVQDGELRASKRSGSFYRFDVRDVLAYMDAHEVEGA